MTTVNMTIDGKKVKARQGSTILEAVRENKIADIPTLCHDPELPPYGSCFLCVVEVKGLNKLVPSCSTPVAEGMEVTTNNERIYQTRKMALELLLSNHYADCVAPCSEGCPANVDVQSYIAMISDGKYSEAVKTIREKNPLPIICGRICVRKCELNCRRKEVDEKPVGINYLKRYASDYERERHVKETPKTPKGKKVAVIGGGPAGLTAAYFLAKEGYSVTIFDMMEKLGGMLRYGIPEYRLPKDLLDQEIGFILDLGIKVKTGVRFGKDFTYENLKKDGFSAVFLGLGAWSSQNMRIEGEETIKEVVAGIDYLREHQITKKPMLKGKVIVVGGGNTAIDAARTAIREKDVTEVTLVYRRTKNEMPADPIEVHGAEQEGVKTMFLTAPLGFNTGEAGELKALRCQTMELGEPDDSGRRRPIPVKGGEFDMACDYLISAIGQKPDLFGIDLEKTKRETLAAEEKTLHTNLEGVFAGGDVVLGPAVVIDAIAQGQKAARAMDKYLSGETRIAKQKFVSKREVFGKAPEFYYSFANSFKRSAMLEEDPVERISDEREVEKGIDEKDVPKEAARCLECGCTVQDSCALRDYATEYDVDTTKYLGEVKIWPVDRTHPFILLDQNKCILCGRCVRTCNDIVGPAVYGFVDRGFNTEVLPIPGPGLLNTDCINCGNCIDVCPTGAIAYVEAGKKPVPRIVEEKESVCSFCSVGCHLLVKIGPMGSWKIGSDRNGRIGAPSNGLLCLRGRFGHEYAKAESRIIKPMVNKSGSLVETSWGEAVEAAVSGMKKHSGKTSGVFFSQKSSIEEMLLLKSVSQKFGAGFFGSLSDLYSAGFGSLDELPKAYRRSTATFEDLERAETIVSVGDIEEYNPVAAMKINKRKTEGAQVFLINPGKKGSLAKKADVSFFVEEDGCIMAAAMNALMEKGFLKTESADRLTSGFGEFEKSLKEWTVEETVRRTGILRRNLKKISDALACPDKKTVFVINFDEYGKKNALNLICAYFILTGKLFSAGNGLLLLGSHSNSIAYQNLRERDFVKMPDSKLMEKGGFETSFVFKEDPLSDADLEKHFEKTKFLVVCDTSLTKTAVKADVFLPCSSLFESNGTFINAEYRVYKTSKIFEPASEKDSKEFLTEIIGKPEKEGYDIENEIQKILAEKPSNHGNTAGVEGLLKKYFFSLKPYEQRKFQEPVKKILDSIDIWIQKFRDEKFK